MSELERHRPQNINLKHKQSLGLQDRIALTITTAVGTMYAVYVLILFMGGWMLWQGHISHAPFDPYPFAFLLFIGNIIQLLLMPLIMVGQNIQSRHAEMRSDEEFKTTVSSFHDVEAILNKLAAQDAELAKQTAILETLLKK